MLPLHPRSLPFGRPLRIGDWSWGLLVAALIWLLGAVHHYFFPHAPVHDPWKALFPASEAALWLRTGVALAFGAGALWLRWTWDALTRSHGHLHEVLERTPDAYLTVDPRWRIRYHNSRTRELFGLPDGDLVGQGLWDLLPDLASNFFKPLQRALMGGYAVSLQGLYPGANLYLEIQAYPQGAGMALFVRDATRQHRYEESLRRTNRYVQTILDSGVDAIVTTDQWGQIETFNPAAERIFGWKREEAVGENVRILMPPDMAAVHDHYMAEYLRTGVSGIINVGPREVTAMRRDGTRFPIDLALSEMRLEDEWHFVGIIRDITDRKEQMQALEDSRRSLQEAQRIARIGSWEWVLASGELSWSDEVFRLFGHEPQAFQPTYERFLEHVHPEDRPAVEEAVARALRQRGDYELEHRVVGPHGTERIVRELGEVELDPDSGEPWAMMGTVQDVTERRRAEDAAEILANYDDLTGLPNRSLLRDRLRQALAHADPDREMVAVLQLDVERFKTINDTLGHDSGDQVLREASERLAQRLPAGTTLARWGNDEFGVLLTEVGEIEQVAHIAQDMIGAFQAPFFLEGEEMHAGASVGIALYPHDADSVDALLRNTESALHRARDETPGGYQFFTADMTADSLARLQLEQALRRALERDELTLFFQPQVDLQTGRVAGVEALLRWEHPEEGLVSPGRFIPVLEETGMIMAAGEWVLRQACTQAAQWRRDGVGEYRMAVNISALQFHHADLVEQVAEILEETGLPAHLLELEITESLLVEDVDSAVRTLSCLHRMGVQVSVDDFGTGYSSMSYLQRFPLHALKLDRSFVSEAHNDPDSAAIARAVLALAHSLRLRVIGEGVEGPEQLTFLRGEGCQEVQGFFFARPMPAREAAAWLAEHGGGVPEALAVDG